MMAYLCYVRCDDCGKAAQLGDGWAQTVKDARKIARRLRWTRVPGVAGSGSVASGAGGDVHA